MGFVEQSKQPTGHVERQTVLAIGMIIAIGLIACAPMLLHGAPNGDSLEVNLAWLKSFSLQVTQGDLYPRWLMGMNRGAGSPAFYYYAPVPFYIASIPVLLFPRAGLMIQLAWGEWLLVVLSGIAFFRYARRRFPVAAATVSSGLYMVLPYHFEIDLWWRQDLGELANYAWTPLFFYYIDDIIEGGRSTIGLAVVYALMVASHLPTTLLISLCGCLYILIQVLGQGSRRKILRITGGISGGVALSAAYWAPALFSESYVRISELWIAFFDFHLWLFPVSKLLKLYPGVAGFVPRLFLGIGLAVAIFTLSWLRGFLYREPAKVRWEIACLTMTVMACLMMCAWSTSVWEVVPELWKVQFPWRFALVADFAAAIAALRILESLRRDRHVLPIIAMMSATAMMIWSVATANFTGFLDGVFPRDLVRKREEAVSNGIDVIEYTTHWNLANASISNMEDTSFRIAGLKKVMYDERNGVVTINQWRAREIELSVRMNAPACITVRQFYFPNWNAKLNRQTDLRVSPSRQNGLLVIDAPAGHYVVVLKLEPLVEEIVGSTITVLGGSIIFGSLGYRRIHHRR